MWWISATTASQYEARTSGRAARTKRGLAAHAARLSGGLRALVRRPAGAGLSTAPPAVPLPGRKPRHAPRGGAGFSLGVAAHRGNQLRRDPPLGSGRTQRIPLLRPRRRMSPRATGRCRLLRPLTVGLLIGAIVAVIVACTAATGGTPREYGTLTSGASSPVSASLRLLPLLLPRRNDGDVERLPAHRALCPAWAMGPDRRRCRCRHRSV